MGRCLQSRLRSSRYTQLVVTGLLSAIVGFTLQITKLTALDSSGRQYGQGSYTGKVGFLAVFGFSKALANLAVGWLVDRLGYARTELAGWLLGLIMPLLVMSAGRGATGWHYIMGANVVLGVQQGLCWSVTVLLMIMLMPNTRRGLASGLNETLGYAAVASAAPVYGVLESRWVRCSWSLPLEELSVTCRAAAAALLSAPPAGGVSDGGGGGGGQDPIGRTNGIEIAALGPTSFLLAPLQLPLASLPQIDPHACTSPDTWSTACLGDCQCDGYNQLLAGVLLVLLPAGLAVTALLLVEPSMTGAASQYGKTGDEGSWESLPSNGMADGSRSRADGPSRQASLVDLQRAVSDGWLGGLRWVMTKSVRGSTYGTAYRHLPPPETRRLLVPPQGKAPPDGLSLTSETANRRNDSHNHQRQLPHSSHDGQPNDAVHTGRTGQLEPGYGGLDNQIQPWASGGRRADGYAPLDSLANTCPASAGPPKVELAFEVAYSDEDGAGQGGDHRRQVGGSGAAAGAGNTAVAAVDSSGEGSREASGAGVLGAGGGATGGTSWVESVRQLGRSFVYYTWHNPSTAVMCLAGLVSNALTSLAWGLVLTWARDELGVPGPARNLLTASYSFLKGLVQLLAGAVSDSAGRKGPIVLGLMLNVAGLLTSACGAGWGGVLLGAAVPPSQRLLVQYGYLLLGSCLMGAGAGVFYPVMPAAVVDHQGQGHGQGSHSMAAGMATYRFWRDLGYAAGALGGPVADVVGVEATLLVAAAVCLVVSGMVAMKYEERAPRAEDGGEVISAAGGRLGC